MSEGQHLKCACKSCGGHIEFPAHAAGMTVKCPHCGWDTELTVPGKPERPPPKPAVQSQAPAPEKSTRRGSMIVIGCVVVVAFAGGFAYWQKTRSRPASGTPTLQPSNADAAVPKSKAAKSPDDLKVSAATVERAKSGGLVYAVGTVRNESDWQRFGVRVELELFDAGGKKLGTATDYVQVIEPRREWKFHALVLDKNAVSARLASVREEE